MKWRGHCIKVNEMINQIILYLMYPIILIKHLDSAIDYYNNFLLINTETIEIIIRLRNLLNQAIQASQGELILRSFYVSTLILVSLP